MPLSISRKMASGFGKRKATATILSSKSLNLRVRSIIRALNMLLDIPLKRTGAGQYHLLPFFDSATFARVDVEEIVGAPVAVVPAAGSAVAVVEQATANPTR